MLLLASCNHWENIHYITINIIIVNFPWKIITLRLYCPTLLNSNPGNLTRPCSTFFLKKKIQWSLKHHPVKIGVKPDLEKKNFWKTWLLWINRSFWWLYEANETIYYLPVKHRRAEIFPLSFSLMSPQAQTMQKKTCQINSIWPWSTSKAGSHVLRMKYRKLP